MEKNKTFEFYSNGVMVTAVVVAIVSSNKYQTIALCYAQNRLFTFYEHVTRNVETGETESDYSYGEVIVNYAVLPEFDDILKAEQDTFDDECFEALSSAGDIEF